MVIFGFRRFLIHGNSSYVVLYTQCLRYNICSAWLLDIRISTCFLNSYLTTIINTSQRVLIIVLLEYIDLLQIHKTEYHQHLCSP